MKKVKVLFRRFRRSHFSKPMQIFVISDCTDQNVQSRYTAAFFRECPNSIVECVKATHLLEAAGIAVDVINEMAGNRGVVFINFAPRRDSDKEKGLSNGPDFVYFFAGKLLVVTTVEPVIFGMFKYFGIEFTRVRSIDCKEERFPKTQFRSGRIIPVITGEILANAYRGKIYEDMQIEWPGRRVWFVDNFGNCKTTLLEELDKYWGRSLHLMDTFVHVEGKILPYYYSLTDVPDGISACIYGSSGYGNRLGGELVIKGASFAKKYGVSVGDKIVVGFQN